MTNIADQANEDGNLTSLATEDYIAIQQLYARYCFAIDGLLDVEQWLNCWTDDGEHRLYLWAPDFPRGKAALRERALASIASRKQPNYHWNSSLLIEPTAYGASGRCYHLSASEMPNNGAEMTAALVYIDQLVKQNGRWLFRQRALGPHGYDAQDPATWPRR